MRRTKIVCTIGPVSESASMIRKLIESGMDVARLNFSHGTHADHAERIQTIRSVGQELGKDIGILLDIQGPKIRTGLLKGGRIELITGNRVILTSEPIEGSAERFSVSYGGLPQDVSEGSTLLLVDGLIGLRVEGVNGTEIHCIVTHGGVLKNRQGINAPGVRLRIESVTKKDIEDIKFGIEQGVDMIAASFVRKPEDVLVIRDLLNEANVEMDIISKIEALEALPLLDDILAVSDGFMVARGDLGVEIPTEEVPIVEKQMISMCNKAGKPVITATQMLDSMERNPRPTRAEASDVANAIFDGSDAIMLSAETASGNYPVESVRTMAQIALRAERAIFANEVTLVQKAVTHLSITDAISHAAQSIAEDLGAKAVVTATQSGNTARMVSKHRPCALIIAATPSERVARRLRVSWGVFPIVVKESNSTDDMLEVSVGGALSSGLVEHGDVLVITAGVPVGVAGTTNMLKVHTVGEVLAQGSGIGQRPASGVVCAAHSAEEAVAKIQPGAILVVSATDKDYVPAMEQAAAIVAVEGGLTSHAAVVALSFGIPVIVGVSEAFERLLDGQVVTIEPCRGLIYNGRARVL